MNRRGFIGLSAAALYGQTPGNRDLDALQFSIGSALSPWNSGYYAGYKVLLSESDPQGLSARFFDNLNSITRRFDPIDPTATFLVSPPPDKHGDPGPQLATSCSFVNRLDGKDYNVIFATQYLKEGLTEGQFLAVLAHEAGHFRQMRAYMKDHPGDEELKHFHMSREREAEADALSLSCPEVQPADFRDMIVAVDRLNDEVARQHPSVVKGSWGTTRIVPFSMQVKLEFGVNHPSSASRVRAAEREMRRRADSVSTAAPPSK